MASRAGPVNSGSCCRSPASLYGRRDPNGRGSAWRDRANSVNFDQCKPKQPHLIARRSGPLRGRVRVPGDKSISHRALILGALAVGETRISGLLEGEDVLNTGKVVAALGAQVDRLGAGEWRVHGVGVAGFAAPLGALDFGNSGTGCRLMLGAVAGCPITATFDGDASLRRRPMRRVLEPLARIGAQAVDEADGRLPLTLKGAREPIPIVFEPPVASAQLKSAVLLAGLAAPGETIVIEAEATRDHTEKMLTSLRCGCARQAARQSWPPHYSRRPARARTATDCDSGRSFLGGVPAGGGIDHAWLRRDPRRRDVKSAAHGSLDDPRRDGRCNRAARNTQ